MIDKKDQQILTILSKDARLPTSTIAKKIGLSREATRYRIERLEKNEIIAGYVSIINTDLLGYIPHDVYLSLGQIKETQIINYLKALPQVMWLSTAAGRWDILSEVYFKDRYDEQQFIDHLHKNFPKKIRELTVVPILKEYVLPLKRFGNPYMITIPHTGAIRDKIQIDRKDIAILDTLSTHARTPAATLATKNNLSGDAVAYRIKKLKEQKLLTATRAKINFSALRLTTYKLLITTSSKQPHEKLLQFLLHHPSTSYVLESFGAWQYNVTVTVKDIYEYKSFLKEVKQCCADTIEKYELVIELDEYKDRYFDKRLITSTAKE